MKKEKVRVLYILTVLFCFALLIPSSSFAKVCKKKKKKNITTQSVEGGVCGWFSKKSKWLAGKELKNGKFLTYSSLIKFAKCKGKNRKVKKLKKKRKTIQALCNNLEAPQSNVTLSALPAVTEMFKAASSQATLQSVSGTPPTISDLANGQVDAADVFFRSGVLDAITAGTPSTTQCDEFWGSDSQDGLSGGMTACYMTEGVGLSFEQVLQGTVSTCYLQNAVTDTTVSDGGVSIVSGTAPSGGLTKIFEPGDSQRVVKIQVANMPGEPGGSGGSSSDEEIFVRVYSTSENSSAGNQYKVDIWFCSNGTPTGTETITVDDNLNFTDVSQGSDSDPQNGGSWKGAVSAALVNSGSSLDFDTSKDRTANVEFQQGSQKMKANIVVTSANLIKQKTYDLTEVSNGPNAARLAYSVASFSGSDFSTLAVKEGAYKDNNLEGTTNTGGFTSAFEYRDTAYFSAPNASTASMLDEVDLTNDSFYLTEPDPTVDLSDVDCNATADIVVQMDFSKSSMQAVANACEVYMQNGFDICSGNQSISSAMNNWNNVCAGP
ncbi:MAG: hypothetical protein D6780_05285 [Candidatus Dadabacteria bacterium]|nr:MAG: hypothetical protein D6780_05285 [Candidatus Dadabacteria bacterium]